MLTQVCSRYCIYHDEFKVCLVSKFRVLVVCLLSKIIQEMYKTIIEFCFRMMS